MWCSVHVVQCTCGAVYMWCSVHVVQCTCGVVYMGCSVHVVQCGAETSCALGELVNMSSEISSSGHT